MKIYDQSVEDEPDYHLLLNVFWPENDMPDARCGDVIIVFSARVSLALRGCIFCERTLIPGSGTTLSRFIFTLHPQDDRYAHI